MYIYIYAVIIVMIIRLLKPITVYLYRITLVLYLLF